MQTENALHDLLLHLENQLLQPKVRHSQEELKKLLSDEFVEIGSAGKMYNREQIIASLADESAVTISIDNFKTSVLASGVALAIYRATFKSDNEPPRHSLRSSIWKFENDTWRMVFHQGTPSEQM